MKRQNFKGRDQKGFTMEQQFWKNISELFLTMEFRMDQLVANDHLDTDEALSNPENNILLIREEIRKQLDSLRISFSEYFTEQESYYILFAIIIYIDEHIQTKVLDKTHLSWPLLQLEFYEIDDGGRLFYDTLDHILKKPQTPLFIYELYYFCLKHGFTGRYEDDALKISEYKKILEEKILVNEIEPEIVTPYDPGIISSLLSPLWYYGIAAVFLGFSYLGFVLLV
jgi:type VI protein secretion system component VasF